jgi:hypothetical protein
MPTPLVSLTLVLACVMLARQSRVANLAVFDRIAAARYAPVALGALNALIVWWVLEFQLNPMPQIQDEAAYLLQAEIFARGRWTEVARPLPEFFAQMHVFTTPVLASKYPPGTSLFYTPFVVLGFTALAPMLLAATAGAFLFVLARRVTTSAVALLTWAVWTTAPTALRWQATFLSQTLTVVLWLAALYLALRYRDEQRQWLVVTLAAVIGLCAITRPLTAMALGIPIGVVIVREVWRARAWRSLALAILTGTIFVAILPVQNRMTTGDWRLSPLVKYSREYLPSDFPGFAFDSSRVVAPLPPDLEQTRQELFDVRRQHTADALPVTLLHRGLRSLTIVVAGWRVGLLALVLIGAIVMPPTGKFGFAMSVGLLLAYGIHSHRAQWSQYYVEAAPVYAFALAVGVWAVAARLIRGWGAIRSKGLWDTSEPRVAVASITTAFALIAVWAARSPTMMAGLHEERAYHRRFAQALELVTRESPKAILFVDYGPTHNAHFSLVRNVPDLADAKTWIAYERGRDDLRLMRLAPERRAYIYHADEGRLIRLPALAELERVVTVR